MPTPRLSPLTLTHACRHPIGRSVVNPLGATLGGVLGPVIMYFVCGINFGIIFGPFVLMF